MARTFTEANVQNRYYRNEVLPLVRGAAESGGSLNDLDIPEDFLDRAREDYELASSSLLDNAGRDLTDIKDGVSGLVTVVGEKPLADADLKRKLPEELGGEVLGDLFKSLMGDGGAEDMASDAIDAPMRIMNDPKGEAKAHPVMAAISAIPFVGPGIKKVIKKFKKVPDLDFDIDVDPDAAEALRKQDVGDMVINLLNDGEMSVEPPTPAKPTPKTPAPAPAPAPAEVEIIEEGVILDDGTIPEIEPEKLISLTGPEAARATMMADKALDATRRADNPISKQRAAKMMATASEDFNKAYSILTDKADAARARHAGLRDKMREVQGRGEIPTAELDRALDEATVESRGLDRAVSKLETDFRSKSDAFEETNRGHILADADEAADAMPDVPDNVLIRNGPKTYEVDDEELMRNVKAMLAAKKAPKKGPPKR